MTANRVAFGAAVGVLTGALALTGCGGSSKPDPTAAKGSPSASSSATSSPTGSRSARPGTTPSAGATTKGSAPAAAGGAERSAVSGKLTEVGDRTAKVAAAAGTVAISWTSATVIVDTVSATARAVKVGSCLLVLPPQQGPSPTSSAITAGVVRVVDSSPSCPPVPGAAPTQGATAGGGTGGSLTLGEGQGVIGTVSAVSRKGFTLRTRTNGAVRTIAVTTNRATVYRKAGEHPRTSIEVGRCATVWGSAHHASRLVATRIRLSDPVDGVCDARR
jgi:hypothetical protein